MYLRGIIDKAKYVLHDSMYHTYIHEKSYLLHSILLIYVTL